MKKFAILTAVALATALGSAAHAAVLASAPTYASTSQRAAMCVVGNIDTKPATATIHVVDELGNELPASKSCLSTIPSQFICTAFANNIANNAAVACVAKAVGNGKSLRGSLTLLDSQGKALRTAELR